ILAILNTLSSCEDLKLFDKVEPLIISSQKDAINPILKFIDIIEIKILRDDPFNPNALIFALSALKTIASHTISQKELNKINLDLPTQFKYISKFHQLAHKARVLADLIKKS
ncbi:MAG: hypothetical protein ACFFDN_28275, partial [Candidatus Hodarchaeota archaeon]